MANSALAFAAAQLLGVAVHEACHALVAQAFGFSPRIYAFVEDNPAGTPLQDILIAAGGPLGSLVVGLIAFALYRLRPKGYGFTNLFLLWLAICGVMTFVNYLIVTPWLAAGDTAVIADRLGWGTLPRYGATLVGLVLVALLWRPAAAAMLDAAPAGAELETGRQRARYVRNAFYLPFFAGLALVALAGIGGKPLYVFYGLLATIGTLDLLGPAIPTAARLRLSERAALSPAPLAVVPIAVALYLALALFYVFALSRGVPI